MMLTPYDHLLFAILTLVLPPRAVMRFRRLRRASESERPRVRVKAYRIAMASLWTMALALLALWVWRRRAWTDLGLVPVLKPGLIGVSVGLAIVVVVMLLQARNAVQSEAGLARVRAQLQNVEFLLPHTRGELNLFFALSVTAGICEELLFRGFMIWYLAHGLGLIQSAAISSVIFGLGHMYQGVAGILKTGAAGAFLAGVYLVSGSLYPCIAVHALMDMYSGFIGHTVLQRSPAVEASGSDTGAAPPT